LWDTAHLEEHWQAELWGKDAEAEARRARRRADFLAAARFAALARG
jgi:chaperone required for assembly of F1-ATPase